MSRPDDHVVYQTKSTRIICCLRDERGMGCNHPPQVMLQHFNADPQYTGWLSRGSWTDPDELAAYGKAWLQAARWLREANEKDGKQKSGLKFDDADASNFPHRGGTL